MSVASLMRRLDGHWYGPAPAERLALLRLAVGGFAFAYLVIRGNTFVSVARFQESAFEPVGPVTWLAEPLPIVVSDLIFAATLAAGLCFLVGFRYRICGPVFALLLLWITSYRSSWGMIFHTDNLLTMHVLILGVAHAADALSLDARKTAASPSDSPKYGWPARAMSAVTVTTYVLAGVAKLRESGLDWVSGDVLRVHVAYDNLRKIELGSMHSPLGAALVSQAWLFPILAITSMVLELGAPLALLHRKLSWVWALAIWSFHVGVLALMAIGFAYPLSGIAYLSFFEVERIRSWKRLPRALRAA